MSELKRHKTITIWKFILPNINEASIQMPSDADILCVQNQFDNICIWARVDTEAPQVDRRFFVIGTGHLLPVEATKYIGSVQTMGGNLVWHIWE